MLTGHLRVLLSTLSLGLLFPSCALLTNHRPNINKQIIQSEISQLGAHNWIIIAEAAYPIPSEAQSKVIYLDASIIEVTQLVLESIDQHGHITPRIQISRESEIVSEKIDPTIASFKQQINETLLTRNYQELPQELIDLSILESQKKYRHLILKTNSTYPYCSLFLELESGYWDGQSESILRTP